jgi:HD-like signal output (HDOD) protein/CheY-like chemotaxis protein
MSKCLLLVDDEPLVLSGLRRSLHSMLDEWTMEYAVGGEAALDAMDRHPFDVVVTDMRMPGMDGAQLLNEVRRRSPLTVRVALSGQCDRETIMSAVGSTHQYISKPCDARELKATINHAIELRNRLHTASVTKIVSQLKTIPSLPAAYHDMLTELSSAEPRLDRLAALVSADMGMAAKCLQLVNSAFFALRTPVSNTLRALNLLGLDMLKSLVLSTHIFSAFATDLFGVKEISWLWEHSFAVSVCARKIAEMQDASPLAIDEAATAGLLHETGKLILASGMGKEYKLALDLMSQTGISLVEAEREVFGCSHAEVGAYLLGLWGLSDSVVEAVAWHLNPCAAPTVSGAEFAPLAAVHAACAYHGGQNPSRLSSCLTLDREYLVSLGLAGREQAWNEACAQAISQQK